MHDNSLMAWVDEQKLFNAREKLILSLCVGINRPLTDRQIMGGLRFTEPNQVRPRITKLVKDGWLYEYDSIPCDVTGKMVRRVMPSSKLMAYGKKEQTEMFGGRFQ